MSKGGGGGANVTELQKEIEMLKKVIADKDVELAACREQLNSKEDAMNRLEVEVDALQESHERELNILYDENLSQSTEAGFKLHMQTFEIDRLRDELKAHVVLEEQNVSLKSAVTKLHETIEFERATHHSEVDTLQAHVSDYQRKLEREFRQRLKEITESVQATAHQGLGSDHRRAVEFSQVLLKKFAETGEQVDVVLKKYDALEAEHKRLRVEHQLGTQARSLQLSEILQLKKELVDQRDRRLGLEREIKEIVSDKSRMIALEAEVDKLKHALRDALLEVTSLEKKLQLTEHELAHSKRLLEKGLRPRTSASAPPSPDATLSLSLLAADAILEESPPKDPRSIWSAAWARTNGAPESKFDGSSRPSTSMPTLLQARPPNAPLSYQRFPLTHFSAIEAGHDAGSAGRRQQASLSSRLLQRARKGVYVYVAAAASKQSMTSKGQ